MGLTWCSSRIITITFTLFLIIYFMEHVNSARDSSYPRYPLQSGWPHLTLYQHENHQGKKYYQEVGPRCYNLPAVFDNEATSLRTHHRCIKVCKERDCRKCIKMAPGTPGHFNLKDVDFNDQISSFTRC